MWKWEEQALAPQEKSALEKIPHVTGVVFVLLFRPLFLDFYPRCFFSLPALIGSSFFKTE